MKLDCIMLIDDDEPTNFINERIIRHSGISSAVKICESGADALDFLEEQSSHPQPGIILLDINMPGMNGWEFLDHYEKLSAEKRAGIILAILSTSMNPDDEKRAALRSSVDLFLSKPLTIEQIKSLVDRYSLL